MNPFSCQVSATPRFIGVTPNQEYSGKSLVIAPIDGEVTLKSWAKPIKGILKHKVVDILISASWFKDSDGNSLDTDIVSHLPNKSLEVA